MDINQSTMEEFYRRLDGEFRCNLCEFTTPHPDKARRHAFSKHGVEIQVVVVVRPHWDLPVENNVPIIIEPLEEPEKPAHSAAGESTKKIKK